jgi:hypothetical protein
MTSEKWFVTNYMITREDKKAEIGTIGNKK